MSNSSDEQQSEETGEGITDEMLPEDLRPTDDNPLAKPMGENEDEESLQGPGPSAGVEDPGSPGES